MGLLELFGMILASGIALALSVSILGLVGLGLVIWGITSAVARITGRTTSQKNLPAGSAPPVRRPTPQAAPVARDYQYLDVDEGATPDMVREAMQPYEGAPYVGEYARAATGALQRADFRRQGLFSILDREFSPHTLTWEKFAAPINVALDGILRNCVQLANRVQGFDTAEYGRLSRLVKAGAAKEGSDNWQRWELFGSVLEEMGELRKSNDQLLFELEKLQGELAKLENDNGDDRMSDIAEEIRNLSDEAKYYS